MGWANKFGAGVDYAIAGRGPMVGRELEWNKVEVKVLQKRVEFYMNDKLMYTAFDTKYREGPIRVGYGCRTFHFKDFMIYTDQQPTSAPTVSPTNNPTNNPTKSPTASPTMSPTERCDANNCMNWSCADWCECYDESDLSIYENHEECQDDNDDTCICFENKEHDLNGERHRKINYNQDAVDAGTAKLIKGTNIHAATKQHHYQEAGATTTNLCPTPAAFDSSKTYPVFQNSVDNYYNYCNYMVSENCLEMCQGAERGRCRDECERYEAEPAKKEVAAPVEFVGCYSTGLIPGWSPWSCDANADTFYYKCNRLRGTHDAMVEECANTCRSRGATQFDIHDRTACFCGTANNVASVSPPITDLYSPRCMNYLYRLNPPATT